ncbi:MAG: hypothetical protein AAF413_00735 [Patescibacteria group bacterium]
MNITYETIKEEAAMVGPPVIGVCFREPNTYTFDRRTDPSSPDYNPRTADLGLMPPDVVPITKEQAFELNAIAKAARIETGKQNG